MRLCHNQNDDAFKSHFRAEMVVKHYLTVNYKQEH